MSEYFFRRWHRKYLVFQMNKSSMNEVPEDSQCSLGETAGPTLWGPDLKSFCFPLHITTEYVKHILTASHDLFQTQSPFPRPCA